MKIQIPYLKGGSKLVIRPEQASKEIFLPADYCCAITRENVRIIYETKGKTQREWFINDHCFVEDRKGRLHLFAINNPYPDHGQELYEIHPYISHFVTRAPLEGWEFCGFALDESDGTRYLGAPCVVYVEQAGKYVMIFESLLGGRRALEIAWSDDLMNFQRTRRPVLEDLGYTKRDPCILQQGDHYLIYLCDPLPGGSAVSVSITKDFLHFESSICLTLEDGADYGGIESPFVLEKNGLFYLFFTYAHHQYYETIVLVSERPDAFHMDSQITTLHGHASEIFSYRGQEYISSCGVEDMGELNKHGLLLNRLDWAGK